jgi:predicted amidophosphoribosyltransferase
MGGTVNGSRLCPQCDHPASPGARFCERCGTALRPGPAELRPPEALAQKIRAQRAAIEGLRSTAG